MAAAIILSFVPCLLGVGALLWVVLLSESAYKSLIITFLSCYIASQFLIVFPQYGIGYEIWYEEQPRIVQITLDNQQEYEYRAEWDDDLEMLEVDGEQYASTMVYRWPLWVEIFVGFLEIVRAVSITAVLLLLSRTELVTTEIVSEQVPELSGNPYR